MEEKKRFIQWVKVHKKELIIAGVSIAVIVVIIVGSKNKDSIDTLWVSLRKKLNQSLVKTTSIKKTCCGSLSEVERVLQAENIQFPASRNLQSSYNVCGHIRNLPEGWHASAEKKATAARRGYKLKTGQTWIDSYTKGLAVA